MDKFLKQDKRRVDQHTWFWYLQEWKFKISKIPNFRIQILKSAVYQKSIENFKFKKPLVFRLNESFFLICLIQHF